jgi:hypothetical protein
MQQRAIEVHYCTSVGTPKMSIPLEVVISNERASQEVRPERKGLRFDACASFPRSSLKELHDARGLCLLLQLFFFYKLIKTLAALAVSGSNCLSLLFFCMESLVHSKRPGQVDCSELDKKMDILTSCEST